MSLYKNPQNNAPLAGACVAVILSVPLAALISTFFGNDYDTRILIYGEFLLWVITGAITIYFMTRNSQQKITLGMLMLWFISVWLWPIPAVMWLLRKEKIKR